MKKSIIKICAVAYAFTTLFTITSCKKNKKLTAENAIVSEDNKSSKIKNAAAAKAFEEGKTLAVLLGYGYNDSTSIASITQLLNQEYGVETADNPGLISIYVYPNDFTVSGKARISLLANLLEDKKLCGLLILGSPEGTHIAISKLQDKTDGGTLDFPVFTIFPQDDVLGSESTSDFVLDYAHKTDSAGSIENAEISSAIPDFDTDKFIINTIQKMLESSSPIPQNENLSKFLQELLGPNRKLTHYIDGESGLKSVNHFIFE